MADDNNNPYESFPVGYIPKNYNVWKDIVGGAILNFIEGIGITFAISLLFCSVPFKFNIKVAFCILTFIIVMILEAKGSQDYTLLVSFMHYTKWKKSAKKYSIGTVTTAPIKKESSLKAISKNFINSAKSLDWKELTKKYEEKLKDIIGLDK